ncbi:MAG: hypothetical protein VB080_09910 [Propionicimonas sp.]|uniref:hypothetical protein n=1 Tax=Propionicimonas sp. TaxID=1955623 RepID=UPI002B20DDA4|nr:hypothetical protein [Propionicimonas sp.]MEA4944734.1 hypothetical protein [Propionicimonas sp.]MEA5053534.1 hypothetical protein [Propionicimonas sp.]
MKRLTITLLVALSLLLAAPRALAADLTPWTLEDANLSLSLPSDLSVITREGIQSNPEQLQELGLDESQLRPMLETANAYLDAVAKDGSHEYMVIVVEPTAQQRVWNLNTATDAMLTSMADVLVKQMAGEGYTTSYDGTHQVGDVLYTIFSGAEDSGADHYLQYYTIVNSRMTSITLHSYTGPLTDAQKETHQQVVDSAQFLTLTEDPNPSQDPTGGKRDLAYNLGYLIGTIIGALAVVAAIVVAVILLVRRSGRKKRAAAEAAFVPGMPPVPGQPDDYPPAQPGGYPQTQPGGYLPARPGDYPSAPPARPTGADPQAPTPPTTDQPVADQPPVSGAVPPEAGHQSSSGPQEPPAGNPPSAPSA